MQGIHPKCFYLLLFTGWTNVKFQVVKLFYSKKKCFSKNICESIVKQFRKSLFFQKQKYFQIVKMTVTHNF